jgi:PPP family 3-phenylpropionic acid transporter
MSLPPLQPEQLVKPRRFELRISLIFAALFIPLGVHVPYFPLWLEAKGFDAEEIGIILAAPMFLRVVTTPLITAAADRSNDRANWLIGTAAFSLLLSLGYFLTPSYAIILAVSLALTIFWTAHSPLADSLALSGVRRFGSSYPSMRIWGSAAFLAGSFFGGIILAVTSADAVPVMIGVGLAGTLAAAMLAPRLGRPRKASPLSATDLQASAPSLLNRYFLLIVTGVGVITASHAFLYGFVSIYWKSIGIGEGIVGLLWSAGVVAEVAVFMVFTRVFGTISSSAVLAIAGMASIVRWMFFPLVEPLGLGLAGFFAVQMLHSLSTGLTLIGLQQVIAETVPDDRTGAAQGIAFFANGFSMAAVTLLCGPLYDRLHGNAFYVMAAIALAGLGLIWLASRSLKRVA